MQNKVHHAPSPPLPAFALDPETNSSVALVGKELFFGRRGEVAGVGKDEMKFDWEFGRSTFSAEESRILGNETPEGE